MFKIITTFPKMNIKKFVNPLTFMDKGRYESKVKKTVVIIFWIIPIFKSIKEID